MPFQDSVFAILDPVSPPKAIVAVEDNEAAANPYLAVFKSLTSVQLVPFQDSVTATVVGVSPPAANAAV